MRINGRGKGNSLEVFSYSSRPPRGSGDSEDSLILAMARIKAIFVTGNR